MQTLISRLMLACLAGGLLAGPVSAQAYDDDRDYGYAAAPDDDPDGAPDDDADALSDEDNDDSDEVSSGPEAAESRCSAEFRSFDPATGTYLSYDGETLPCPYL